MDSFPEYSEEALASLDLFHRDQVDLIFYFEDQGAEVFYERLITRLFPKLKLFTTVCLGGKTQVLKKARSVILEDKNSKKLPAVNEIFIIDKDFDDLLNSHNKIDRVFYFHKHSIENYLFDIDALVAIAIEHSNGKLSRKNISEKCSDLDQYVIDLKTSLIEMTKHFFLVQRFRIPVESTKMSTEKLLSLSEETYPLPTKEKIQDYRTRIQEACTDVANDWLTLDQAFDLELAKPLKSAAACPIQSQTEEDHIVGKHLLGCFLNYLSKRLDLTLKTIDYVQLYLRVVNLIDLSPLSYLVQAIRQRYPALP